MAKLKINMDELIFALEDQSYETEHFLDLKTGETVMLVDSDFIDEDDDLRESIENEPERYLFIDPVNSGESYQIMEDFLNQLSCNDEVISDLQNALYHSKSFKRFKDALSNYPEIREDWFKFHNQEMKETAKRWLEYNDIDAELLSLPDEK